MILGNYSNENGSYTVYWDADGRILEDNGQAEVCLGYAETEDDAKSFYESMI